MPSKIKNKKISKKLIRKNLLFIKNNLAKIQSKNYFNRHRSVITKKSCELSITNKYKDKLSPKVEKPNQNDTLEVKEDYFNDIFSNKSHSTNNKNNIIKNSSYNIEDEILQNKKDSFFDDNFILDNEANKKNDNKKIEKKLIKKYKFDCSDDLEKEDNEDMEEPDDKNNNKNKSFSWIIKLNEISKNEETKTGREKDEQSKKKKGLGASTTRSQTKRKENDREKDINKNSENYEEYKLYMLNLRNSSSTGKLRPYIFMGKDPIFYKFFLKK